METNTVHYLFGRLQAEQRAAAGNTHKLSEHRGSLLNMACFRFGLGIGKQTGNILVGNTIAQLWWQTYTPVVALFGEVHLVKPIASVVAVGRHRLGAQQLGTHLDERDTLAQYRYRQGQAAHTGTVGNSHIGWHGARTMHPVPQGFVVVFLYIVDSLLWVSAIGAHGRSSDYCAGFGFQFEIFQVARQTSADSIQIVALHQGHLLQRVADTVIESTHFSVVQRFLGCTHGNAVT